MLAAGNGSPNSSVTTPVMPVPFCANAGIVQNKHNKKHNVLIVNCLNFITMVIDVFVAI